MTTARLTLFRRSHGDRVFRGILTVAAVIIPLLLALLIWQLAGMAAKADSSSSMIPMWPE